MLDVWLAIGAGLAFVLAKSPLLTWLGWWFFSAVIVLGAVCLAGGIAVALASLAVWTIRRATGR